VSEMANPAPTEHEAHHRALVERMVAELRPVRRLWPVSLRLALWLALEAVMLLFAIRHNERTIFRQPFGDPWYLLSVGSSAGAGVVGAALALRSAIPGREPRARETGLMLILVLASLLVLLHGPINAGVPMGTFIATGLGCAFATATLACLPLSALLWAMRRGAPLERGLGGALAGAGAFLIAFALMRVRCPINEGLHLFVWHFLPALIGIAISAGAGLLLFHRRASE
jgi:hypothetical protein